MHRKHDGKKPSAFRTTLTPPWRYSRSRGLQTMALQLFKYYKSHHASASGSLNCGCQSLARPHGTCSS
ncbi:unnamed protein product [Staurois parvus]|uniref:Uncharacterized protein n=1 Tax=Staurois parvus TaxID=386267 RepID=A0ABN9D7C8_9NEOB|nr:unnamed protein product [Staurois parvus]